MVTPNRQCDSIAMSAPMVIYLQFHNQKDDTVVINREPTGQFRSTFYNNSIGRGYKQVHTTYENLMQYLDSFMMLNVFDMESCDFVQIDIPGLPAIVIRPTQHAWESVLPYIRRYLCNICESSYSWPKQFKLTSDLTMHNLLNSL